MKEAPGCTCKKGFMTIEAAIIIPFLTCLFVFVLFFFRMMQVQLQIQSALEHTGRELAVYASFFEDGPDNSEQSEKKWEYLVIAKNLFAMKLRKCELIDRFVSEGTRGVSLIESQFEGNEIYLKASYQMKFPVNLLGKKAFAVSQKSVYRKWTGWNAKELYEGELWVYIAKNGQVYHKTSACTYLKLSIQSVDEANIPQYRNESGQKYRECTECAEKESTFCRVYITNYGDCYHKDLNCSGIKRTIEMVRLSDTGGKGACSKCWN